MSKALNQKCNSDTVTLGVAMYRETCDQFKEICRKLGKFHSEVVRDLIYDFNEKNKALLGKGTQQKQKQETQAETEKGKTEKKEKDDAFDLF